MSARDIPKYLSLYGFQHAPFRLSPDPYFFFPASTHVMAEKILSHALENNEGFLVLSGAAGLGKTLLLRLLLEEISERKIPALILSSAVSPLGLLQLLLSELGVSFKGGESEAVLLQRFQETVLRHAQDGRDILIVVDEAQNMPVTTLEQLRMLSNVETKSRKLLQILLIGQEQLVETLKDHRLAQLVQRVVIHQRLRPMTRDETGRYVVFRCKRAGRQDIRLTRSAVWLLQSASGGVPRLINKIMDRTLLLAGERSSATIKRQYVHNAVATMEEMNGTLWSRNRALAVAAFGAVVLLWLLSVFIPVETSRDTRDRLPVSLADQMQAQHKTQEPQDSGVADMSGPQVLPPSSIDKSLSAGYNRFRIHPVVYVDRFVPDTKNEEMR